MNETLREMGRTFDLPDSPVPAIERTIRDGWNLPPEPWDIADIKDRGDLAKSWIDTFRAAKLDPRDGNLDRKLGTLTRWLLAAFEGRPNVRLIFVAARDVVLRPGNGEILMDRLASAYDLAEVPCPLDPEDAIHPGASDVQPVTFDFAFMDEG